MVTGDNGWLAWQRAALVLLAIGAVLVTTIVVVMSPWPLALGLAVSIATAWTIWLERHPRPEP